MDKQDLLRILELEGYDKKIVRAFDTVKRETFISESLRRYAYENRPLPIGYGQTISQPSTIAFMLKELELYDGLKILEIGSGSGYVLALMEELSKDSEIIGIERMKPLADASRKMLEGHNLEIVNYNGFDGYKEKAPYDRILVSAAANEVNDRIVSQLSDNGIAVMPIRDSIVKIWKEDDMIYRKEFFGFVFVPLVP